ncbi:MAG TPA: DUF4062 domain-containing protein [Planctomycetota bacterium]|nr:DUF4062 domain-containing protein [Planctomycetota bacterium]
MTSVFLSSVMGGVEAMREAAVAACDSLDIKVTKAEDFQADPASPRGACLRGVGAADGFLLLIGSRYGNSLASGKSATEEEFDEAVRLRKEVFVFRTAEQLEEAQASFLKRVGDWRGGHFYRTCTTAAALQRDIVKTLRAWSSAPETSDVDAIVRANLASVMPRVDRGYVTTDGPWLALSWSPNQRLFLDDEVVFERLPEIVGDRLVAGPSRLLRTRPSTTAEEHGFRVQSATSEHPELAGWIGSDGSFAIGVDVVQEHQRGGASMMAHMYYLSPQELAATIARLLAFVGAMLDEVDPDRRCTAGRMQASLARMGTRVIGEPRPGQSSFQVGVPGDARRDLPKTVPPSPVTVVRSILRTESPEVDMFVKRFQRLCGDAR